MRKKNGLQRERERELYQINEKENGFRERERAREREVFSLGKMSKEREGERAYIGRQWREIIKK